MNRQQKEAALLDLAHKRQNTQYEGHTCIGDYDNGIWECDHVSPCSLSANNVNANVMIILQHWCSSDSFDLPVCEETLKLGHTPSVKTNIYLKDLLNRYQGLCLRNYRIWQQRLQNLSNSEQKPIVAKPIQGI